MTDLPSGSTVLICTDCTGPHPSDAVVAVFPDDAERDRWKTEHKIATGHGTFWLAEGLRTRDEVVAAYAGDMALRDRLRAGDRIEDLPTAEQVIARLRDSLTHPEQVGPTLQPAEVAVLLTHIDDLTHPHTTRGDDHDDQ